MPTIAEQLSAYATSLHYRDLPPEAVHHAKRMMIDTIGCALGGYTSEPSKIARDLASTVTSTQPCTVIGSGLATSPDLATFANGVMIRYLDYNDGYTSKESGHPSDSIAAVLAAAEMAHAGGRRAIVATIVAYETFCRLGDAATIRYLGWDHVTNGCIGSIVGATRALGLGPEQTHQALNLGIAPNIALGQTRAGVLSHWKGCAYANASRNAVFAVMLAQRGLTGPTPVFEGEHGFFAAVTRGEAYELEPFGGVNGQPFKIAECSIKRFPLGQYSQTIAQAALEVRNQIPNINVNDIAQVKVRTLQKAIDIMAGDDEKWHPKTRETADHSMPYATAVILKYGTLTQHHFDDEYIHDRELLDLVQRVKVEVSEEANRRAPEAMLCDVEVVTRAGRRYTSEVAYHKGHHKNPLTDAEVEDKFRSLAKDLLTPAQTEALLQRLWHLDEVTDVRELMGLMRI
ncbi:MAG: MmgE/PrpD family protein [Dehalococcoidia bacterium]|nr:MmgE/PrpD family protein [Dehalococcoidia bacterium]MSQ17100.1 MmgE/PrpD family protein [Dehalococcoidia bacterium]